MNINKQYISYDDACYDWTLDNKGTIKYKNILKIGNGSADNECFFFPFLKNIWFSQSIDFFSTIDLND